MKSSTTTDRSQPPSWITYWIRSSAPNNQLVLQVCVLNWSSSDLQRQCEVPVCTANHTVFSFSLELIYEWVFQKAEITRAVSASAISAFWKTRMQVQINFKNRMITYYNTNMKNSRGGSARRSFLKPFFSYSRKRFSKFSYKIVFIVLHEIIGLQNFSVFPPIRFRITMCNLHWCYTFCTGYNLELHCSQSIRIE